jgi:hypothetical protein
MQIQTLLKLNFYINILKYIVEVFTGVALTHDHTSPLDTLAFSWFPVARPEGLMNEMEGSTIEAAERKARKGTFKATRC